jgi:hypothetical protein
MAFIKAVAIMTSLYTAMAGCWTNGQFWKWTKACTLTHSKPSDHEAQISLADSVVGPWMQCSATGGDDNGETPMCPTWTDDNCIKAGVDWCTEPFMETVKHNPVHRKIDILFRASVPYNLKIGKPACNVEYGGNHDGTDFVTPTRTVVVCHDRGRSSNSARNQKFFYMLAEGCDPFDEDITCGAEFVGKTRDVPKNLTLTEEWANEMCGHYENHPRSWLTPDRSINFKVAAGVDKKRVEIALANGMFGEYEVPYKNCNAKCLYDVDIATSEEGKGIAWIWDIKLGLWKQQNEPQNQELRFCWGDDTLYQRNYAKAKSAKLYNLERLV